MLFPNLLPAMNLTLAIPSLNRQSDESVPSLTLPAFNRLLRFGHLHKQAVETSEFYGRYLWDGSLLEHAKTAANVPQQQPAALASPLWQQMGLHQVSVVGGEYIGIATDEADELCRELSDFYQDEGWRFVSVRPDLWLVLLPNPQDWQIKPALDIYGQMGSSEQASGKDSGQWLAKQTEIQMWLHQHPINNIRNQLGTPPINGLWLWHDIQGTQQSPSLFSDSPWAQFASGRIDAPYDFRAFASWMQETRTDTAVIFMDDLAVTGLTADVLTYQDILQDWEQRWFDPIWQALHTGRLKNLTLTTDGENGGVLTLTPKSRWKFWRAEKIFTGIW